MKRKMPPRMRSWARREAWRNKNRRR